jgi:hypothetical protein
MTTLETLQERPEFETVALSIETDEVRDRVHGTLKGLNATETTDGIKFRTTGGMLIAVVGDRSGTDDEAESELAYRAAPAAQTATRKGRKVFEALEPYTV